MNNLHFFVPCHSTTFKVVAGWLLLLLSVTEIVKGCNRDSMQQVQLYLLQWQICLNLETISQTQLSCHPIFHNACNRNCHLANCPSHACICSVLWSFKHCFWRRNTTHHMGPFRPLYMEWIAVSGEFLHTTGPLKFSCSPCSHIPLELWFLYRALASHFALFLSFFVLIQNKSGIGCYYW